MNTPIKLIALATLALVSCPSAFAQIRDNEASIHALTAQCSMSSGVSDADYRDYSSSLAKTLALMNPAQQKRIFGYVPTPSGSGFTDPASTRPAPDNPGASDAPLSEDKSNPGAPPSSTNPGEGAPSGDDTESSPDTDPLDDATGSSTPVADSPPPGAAGSSHPSHGERDDRDRDHDRVPDHHSDRGDHKGPSHPDTDEDGNPLIDLLTKIAEGINDFIDERRP